MQVEVRAVETFAELLFAVDSEEGQGAFFDRLCEAACQLASLDRAIVFLYDPALRRVRVAGSHRISVDDFRDMHIQVDSAPIALRALSEDKVLEITDGFEELLPEWSVRFLDRTRLICTPIAAAGRWPGVVLGDRPVDKPLTDSERHLLWSLGKIAALAASARLATREAEHARMLQGRIDLARDIHEGVVQRLFGVSLALTAEDLPKEQLKRCADEIQEALAELRTAVQRPLGRSSREATSTLVDEVAVLAELHPDIAVEFDAETGALVPDRLQDVACSVLRESLRNALKHADPRRIAVTVARDDAFVLTIVNDGVHDGARGRAGMGLRIAAVEALQFGGVVEFGPAGDGEWRVRLIVPVEDPAP